MRKKIILFSVIGVFLVFGSMLFLFWLGMQQLDTEPISEITPTQWSQAEDYAVEEVKGEKIVTNKKAGLRFTVPMGWEIKRNDVDGEYWLTLLSPDVKFTEKNEFIGGCGINVEVVDQQIEVNNTKADMSLIEKNLDVDPNKKIIKVNGYNALQILDIPKDSRILKRIGEVLRIYIPVSETVSVNFITQFLPTEKEKCSSQFQEFIKSVLID